MGVSSALGSSALLPAGLGFRNKIINGDMRIAQRGTSAITGSASKQFVVDRWVVYNGTGTVTFQQSTVAPPGFTNSIIATVTATGSYGTSGYTEIGHFVECTNVSDLAWGTSSAKQVVLSFWVRSSVTGQSNVTIQNSAQNRSYVATYTISSANTWERKVLYITPDSSGTWPTDSANAFRLWFNLGMGSSYDTTPNTWAAGNFGSSSSDFDFAANAGATFYLTGVQLEANYQPTPFEQRPFSVELALCQRYYEKSYDTGTAPGTTTEVGVHHHSGSGNGSGRHYVPVRFKVEKRVNTYTVSTYSPANGASANWLTNNVNQTNLGRTPSIDQKGTSGFIANVEDGGYAWIVGNTRGHWVADAEL
jgi:hypothetical protein